MAARHQRNELLRMPAYRRSWLAVPLAILSNALLFYLLAGVRTTPAAPRIEKKQAWPVAVVHLPIPEAEQENMPPELDFVSAVVAPRPEVEPAVLPDTAAVPTPRLLNGIEAVETELPGLPVIQPGRADLWSAPSSSVSSIDLPHALSGVDRPPRRITGALPQVPSWARRARLEGAVVLRFIVTAQGDVTDVNVSRVEGDERFGREAARTVATWRFEPATKRGNPVPCWCFQKVNFRLDD